jgi:hypothetical protein
MIAWSAHVRAVHGLAPLAATCKAASPRCTQVINAAGDERCFTLDDLKTKYPKETITATLQCAGNRRSEMSAARKVNGLPWQMAAVGNAEWSGVRLSTILKDMGVKPAADAKHVQFVGLDCDMNGALFATCTPTHVGDASGSQTLYTQLLQRAPVCANHHYRYTRRRRRALRRVGADPEGARGRGRRRTRIRDER